MTGLELGERIRTFQLTGTTGGFTIKLTQQDLSNATPLIKADRTVNLKIFRSASTADQATSKFPNAMETTVGRRGSRHYPSANAPMSARVFKSARRWLNSFPW